MNGPARPRWRWIVAAGSLGLYVLLAGLIRLVPDNRIDRSVLSWVSTWDVPFIEETMEWASWITDLRPRLVLGVVGVVAIVLAGRLRTAAATVAVVVVAAVVVDTIDLVGGIVADRIRPNGAPFLAYPSGHTLGAFVQYGFGIYLVLRMDLRRSLLVPLVILQAVPVILVGPSRLFLGVHWPTDILGSYLLGTASLIALVPVLNFVENALARRDVLDGSLRPAAKDDRRSG